VTDTDGEITVRWRYHSEDAGLDASLTLPRSGQAAPDVIGGCAPTRFEDPAG
jgi:hypothetical protein